jgi:hypothetical protein
MMTDRQIPPIPRRPDPTETELSKRERIKTRYFKDSVFPDDTQLTTLFATMGPTAKSDILHALPSLLPTGELTTEIADSITATVVEINDRFQSTTECALSPVELATIIQSMPCQHAGEAFLHLYKHLFQDMVTHQSCMNGGKTC